MLKRVLAWIILIGFVLLLLNIAIFHFYWQVCLAVYVVIIIFFVLSNGKIVPSQTEDGHGQANGGDIGVDAPDKAGEGIRTDATDKAGEGIRIDAPDAAGDGMNSEEDTEARKENERDNEKGKDQ